MFRNMEAMRQVKKREKFGRVVVGDGDCADMIFFPVKVHSGWSVGRTEEARWEIEVWWHSCFVSKLIRK